MGWKCLQIFRTDFYHVLEKSYVAKYLEQRTRPILEKSKTLCDNSLEFDTSTDTLHCRKIWRWGMRLVTFATANTKVCCA